LKGIPVGHECFKSGVPSAEGGRWVRFPCTSANFSGLGSNGGLVTDNYLTDREIFIKFKYIPG
jgi:hypothetical protein